MLFVRLSSTMFPFFKKILHLEFENGLNLTQHTPVDPTVQVTLHFCVVAWEVVIRGYFGKISHLNNKSLICTSSHVTQGAAT